MKKRRLNETGRLMPRDRKILAHVARHRLTTVSVMHQALFPDLSHTAVAKVAARLTRHKYLRKYTLRHPVRYFVLGEAGAGLLGLGIHRTESLGPQALPLEYAALLYSTLGKQPRTRLNRGELVGRFPWFLKRWLDGCHCLDERAHVLELLRVDFGGSADHVARRCAHDIQLRLQSPDFLKLLAVGQFRLVLITATPEKGAALRRALNRHEWPQGLLLHLSVIPELLIFQGRRTHA